jgi:hypothetical protein
MNVSSPNAPDRARIFPLVAVAALLAGAPQALAHTIVGERLFPTTLAIDDPGVNDELALPSFAYMTGSNFDKTPGPINYSLGWEYAKTITADLGVSIGSEGFNWQRRPNAQGWSNLETQLKYVFWQDPKSEAIISGAVNVEWGNTGSPQSASLPADPFSTVTTKLYAGKGFGDAPVEWARPFALTGEIAYSIPTRTVNGDGSLNPSALTYGATLQYSLLYRNAHVEEVPELFRRLIPAFEAVFTTPIAHVPPSSPDDFPAHTTTGVFGPSLYYIGKYFEIGVMAQIPVNRASGSHVGALAVINFFLDDIAPNSLGKPLFGPAQARGGRY